MFSKRITITAMKSTILLLVKLEVLLLLTCVIVNAEWNRRLPYQRLVQPSHGTRMTIAPGLCLPNMQMSTVESAMEMRMPISVNFPTAGEVAAQFLNQALSLPTAVSGSSNREETSKDSGSNSSIPLSSSSSSKSQSRESRAMKSRIAARQDFYKTVEKAHPTFGKSCLLRAICEVSEVPFVSAHTGFIGEMFDILLT